MNPPTPPGIIVRPALPPAARLLLAILAITLAVGAIARLDARRPLDVDSGHYIDIAEGHIHEVHKPFSGRVLHPMAARGLVALTRWRLSTSFRVIGLIALVVLVTTVLIATRSIESPAAIVVVLFSPVLVGMFQQCYLPDLFHAAATGLFMVCVVRNRMVWAMALLALLFVARESTILLAVVVVLISALRRRWRVCLGAAIAACLGMTASAFASDLGQPNIHNTSAAVYLAGKLVYNVTRNVFGVVLWTNTLAANDPSSFPNAPMARMLVPPWLPLGSIHEVGFYGFAPIFPATTLTALLTSFGALPAVLFLDIRRYGARMVRDAHMAFGTAVALVYGIAASVGGIAVGASIVRLVAYGWPAFWIAAPVIAREWHARDGGATRRFLACQVILCWCPSVLELTRIGSAPRFVITMCMAAGLYGLAAREVRRTWEDAAGTARAPA